MVIFGEAAGYIGIDWFVDLSTWEWKFYTLAFFLLTMPVYLIQDLKKYSYINVASFTSFIVLILVIFGTCFYDVFLNLQKEDHYHIGGDKGNLKIMGFSHFWEFVGIATFSIEAPALLLPIRASLKKKKDFNRYYMHTVLTVSLITVLLGTLVYLVKKPQKTNSLVFWK